MKVYGLLEKSQFELLAAAPSVTPTAAIYFNTTTNVPQMYMGAAWLNLMTIGVQTKTGNYTVTPSDDTIVCNAASAGFTITLVAASTCTNKVYRFKKSDTSRNIVTITPNGSDTIDGQTNQTLNQQGDILTLVSDGTTWWLI